MKAFVLKYDGGFAILALPVYILYWYILSQYINKVGEKDHKK